VDQNLSGGATVQVELQVMIGALGIGILRKGNTSEYIVEKVARTGDGLTTVDLVLPQAEEAGDVVLRNWSPDGASRVNLVSVTVMSHE
jgi:hypothetical protein